MSTQKKIVIFAGPNGAGKTTFAQEFLPNEAGCPVAVNADFIAAGLSPFRPEEVVFRAGRLMLAEIAHHAALGRRFLAVVRQWRRNAAVTGRTSPSMSAVPTPHTESNLDDTDMRAAPVALLRAARRAREVARQTGTAVVVVRDGKLVEERDVCAQPPGRPEA
jgi:hypothetical protein